MATLRSLGSALARSPLFWVLAILLPFALGNPAFRATVVFVVYAVVFATGSVVLVGIALAGAYWIGADVLRGYRGPSLWSLLVTIGEWEGRCAARAVDNVLWLLDRIYPAGPTGALGIPACPTCPFGECAGCEVIDTPPVLTPALAADIHAVYARFAGIPTATAFCPAPAFRPLAAPLARLLPSWEEVDASREPIALRPDTSSEQGPAFDTWKHENRGDRFPLFLAPATPLLTYRPLTIAPLPAVRPDVTSDPCDPSDCPVCPITLASGRHETEPGTWTAEIATVAACGPIQPTAPRCDYCGCRTDAPTPRSGCNFCLGSLPSDSDLDALALSDWPGSETEEAADEKANALSFADALDTASARQIAQDAPGTPEPAPEPSGADSDLFRPDGRAIGRDRLRKIAKAEGVPYSGNKDGADALVAKIRAHRAYR